MVLTENQPDNWPDLVGEAVSEGTVCFSTACFSSGVETPVPYSAENERSKLPERKCEPNTGTPEIRTKWVFFLCLRQDRERGEKREKEKGGRRRGRERMCVAQVSVWRS